MKNITVTVDEATYRRARIKAAERDTSVSGLVKQFLTDLASEESDLDRLLREERSLRARVTNFSASDRLPRDECTIAGDDREVDGVVIINPFR